VSVDGEEKTLGRFLLDAKEKQVADGVPGGPRVELEL